jgi:uncharacterized protein involved in exopolysaccharide biosynthesis
MSAPPARDLGVEREIDLSRWRVALAERWWVVAVGVVIGIVVGAIYGLSGGSVWEASVLIAPGQPFSPNGSPVLTYQSSPRGISALVTSGTVVAEAAKAAAISPGALSGHIATSTVSTGASTSAASRGGNLIKITVDLNKKKHAEVVVDKLGKLVLTGTTSPYVTSSITSYQTKIDSYNEELKSLQSRIDAYTKALATATLQPIDRLTLTINQSNNEQLLATIEDELSTTQQQLTLAENVEKAQLVGPQHATAVKSTARSRRNSILFGALIGLILGVIAAIVVDTRASRARRA